MIFDRLDRLTTYRSLSPNLRTAIDWLTATDLKTVASGKVEIAGNDVFAIGQAYDTKPIEQTKWESHRKYIDIQVIVSGTERIDVSDVATLLDATPFDVAKDAGLYGPASPVSSSLEMQAGQFAIFFPHDGHRPLIAVDGPTAVKKVVVKVAI